MSKHEIKRLRDCQQRSLETQEFYHQQLNKSDKRGDQQGVEHYREKEMEELKEYYRLQDQIESFEG